MAPHLDRWDSELRDKGLRVIEVELGPATPLATLEAHLQRKGVAYPVLHDGDGSVTARFAVKAFPTAFLVGRNGRVIWHGYPTKDLGAVDAAIRKALGS